MPSMFKKAYEALAQGLSLSQEDHAESGQIGQEIEYLFFYKLTDLSQLLKAPKIEEQEQYELVLPKAPESTQQGFLRVRSARLKGAESPTYTLTLKVAEDGVKGRKEAPIEINQEFFELYRGLCPKGMTKTRFFFPVEGGEGRGPDGTDLVWEIDVFADPTTEGACPWVKVDLEVPAELTEIPPFPLSYTKKITNQWDQRTEAEQTFIKSLWEQVYTPALEPEATDDESVA